MHVLDKVWGEDHSVGMECEGGGVVECWGGGMGGV